MYGMPAGMRLWSLVVMEFGIGVVRKCRSLGIHGGQAPEYFSVVEPADLEQFLAVRITAQQHDRRLRQLQRRSQQFLNRGIGLAVFRRRRHRELEATPLPAEHGIARGLRARSEEHTSELQSLMRISYAVFCLKKQKKNKAKINTDISK